MTDKTTAGIADDSGLSLIIGDKNLSSWSLRPWLVLKQAAIPFAEETVRLDRPGSRAELKRLSPSGLVPALKDGEQVIWDSLAICEYLNDRFPEKQLWPTDAAARAHARAISAEMHAGFSSLRTVWPVNFVREGLDHLRTGGVQRDIDRIAHLWTEARETYGRKAGGPFLYGAFSIADAMYAPVVSRFRTYGPVDLPTPAGEWMDMIRRLPSMREWGAGAARELDEA